MKLDLEIEEINQILGIVGQQPYGQVFQLVSKIQQQAQPQMEKPVIVKNDNPKKELKENV